MKKRKLLRILPTFILVVTLYLPDLIPATAAELEPTAEGPDAISENTLPAEPENISENMLPEESESISSAPELTAWLECHKQSGGRARLTEDISMDVPYQFVPYPNIPPLCIETDGHTIFVGADVEFLSDGRLSFQGECSEKGVFHVEKGGSLLLDGVIVETSADGDSTKYALWQEEGSGLILGNTFASSQISGNIRYADSPFVMDTDDICMIVNKGQLFDGLLPAEIDCRVNYQGNILEHAPTAVVWDTAGTEKQQQERQRFQAQGIFPKAASNKKPVCTIVYHDYPLTFTNTEAFIRCNAYTFQGGFTRQEEMLSAETSPEYSFDGETWINEKEDSILKADKGYYIAFPCDQWDTSAYPYLYIRLRAETKEQTYYSNILRYAADHLDTVEDLGGSRGGGTAVINPPQDPEKIDTAKHPEASEKPKGPNPAGNTNPPDMTVEAASVKTENPSAESFGQTDQDSILTRDTAIPNLSPANRPTDNPSPASQPTDCEKDDYSPSDKQLLPEEAAVSVAAAAIGDQTAQTVHMSKAPSKQTEPLALAAGFTLLAAAAGALYFFVHTGSDSSQRRRSASSGGTKR